MNSFPVGGAEFFDIFFDLAESGRANVRRGYGGWVPEVYDLMEGDFEDDLPMILALARRVGGPVVDLGSGTGRLTIPLASEGLDVFAVDSDPMMHSQLRRNSEGLGLSITSIEAQIQTFELPEKARLAVCSTNTFLYLGSLEEQRRALANIRRNLAVGGHLWLDVFVPKPNPSAEEPYLTSHRDPDSGILLLYGAESREDHFQGRSHVNAFTLVWGRKPQPEVYVQSWTYAWLHPAELTLLLEAEGFELVELLGDYEGEAADDCAVQMIAVARVRP
ncbi:MAG: class I SAM-dependent methyltransferase [Armatimonadetes bacterium]|nr:class I SAM-dependent methyltransferase [Armatimonadota bacterium]